MSPEDILSRLLYRDGLMLIIDKPAGLAVHRGPEGKKGGASIEDYFDALRFGLPRQPAHRVPLPPIQERSRHLAQKQGPPPTAISGLARQKWSNAFHSGQVLQACFQFRSLILPPLQRCKFRCFG